MKGAPSGTPRGHGKAASVVLLDESHRLQSLLDVLNAINVARVEATLLVRYAMRHKGRSIAELESFKVNNFANMAVSILCRNFSFVAMIKSVMSFKEAFKKEQSVSFLAARMVNIVERMTSSDLPTSTRIQTYKCYIRLVTFFFQCPNTFNSLTDTNGDKTGAMTLGISHLDD